MTGTLNLSGASTFSGGTTISGGRLSITGDGALGAVPATFNATAVNFTGSGILSIAATGQTLHANRGITVATGATAVLEMPNTAALTVAGAASGTGNLTIDGGLNYGLAPAAVTFNGGANTLSGQLTINNGMTLSSSGSTATWQNLSSLALNGGAFTIVNGTATPTVDRLKNSAPITVNGGTLNYNNTASSSAGYAETIGIVTLASGTLNIAMSGSMTAPGSQTLTLGGLSRTGSTSTAAFSALTTAPNAATNRIVVTGATPTSAGQIIGPWATTGTAATAQTDYAFYDASGRVIPAGVTATANDSTWTTTYSVASNVNLSGAATLSATRVLNTLRYSGAAATLALGSNNLNTYGILSGGASLLTISGTGAVSTPTGGGNLFLVGGSSTTTNGITISAPINDNGGAVGLVIGGPGNVTLTGTNGFSGGVVINSGYLTAYSDASLGAAGAVGTPANTITFNGSGQLNLGNGTSGSSGTR